MCAKIALVLQSLIIMDLQVYRWLDEIICFLSSSVDFGRGWVTLMNAVVNEKSLDFLDYVLKWRLPIQVVIGWCWWLFELPYTTRTLACNLKQNKNVSKCQNPTHLAWTSNSQREMLYFKTSSWQGPENNQGATNRKYVTSAYSLIVLYVIHLDSQYFLDFQLTTNQNPERQAGAITLISFRLWLGIVLGQFCGSWGALLLDGMPHSYLSPHLVQSLVQIMNARNDG